MFRQFEFSSGKSPVKSANEYLESKCLNLQKEIEFWKEKCSQLSSKFVDVLKKIKSDNQKMRSEVVEDYEEFKDQYSSILKKATNIYKKVP